MLPFHSEQVRSNYLPVLDKFEEADMNLSTHSCSEERSDSVVEYLKLRAVGLSLTRGTALCP